MLFDKAGRVAGLHETWLFDDLYTAFIVEEITKNKGTAKPSRKDLDALMKVNMRNLAEYDYFTLVKAKRAKVPLAGATDYATRMRKDRLEMSFRVNLAKPVNVAETPLNYAIFDPSYYIEMLHAETADPVRLVGAGAHCQFRIDPPDPDPSAIALAAALDRTQSGGNGLGKLFAQWVEVRCDRQP